jgi:RNA polymerase sigma-70 factor (ECF subfamily)
VRPGESSEAPTTLAHSPDADLVARVQQGEEAAFTSLFEAHKRSVYSLCLRMTRSPADAEDLTQEAFLQVFRKLATFRGESTFSTWLHGVTVNLVLMHLRKKRHSRKCLSTSLTVHGKSRPRGSIGTRTSDC